ncbi:MAG: hypothetical protein WCH07_04425 [Deltaproteobacteria bacterium]
MRAKKCTEDDLQKSMDAVNLGNNRNIEFKTIQFVGELKEARVVTVKIIKSETINKCPHFIFDPDHYKQDGTCLCFDNDHQEQLRTAAAIRHEKYKQVAMRKRIINEVLRGRNDEA